MRFGRRVRLLVLACAGALLLGVALCPAREVPLTILHTTDLHGCLLADDGGGGLLRCASLIEDIRARERNVMLVDGGDLVQGSAASWLTKGAIMVRALDGLRYDAWVLGNHEFDWGLDCVTELQRRSRTPVLAANIGCAPGAPHPLDRIHPFIVKEMDGIRVAIVGLTTPGVPNWTLPEDLGGLRFESSVEALARILPRIREARPDVMVLVVHQGCQEPADDEANQVRALARQFPEFDVMLGGHLHTMLCGLRLHGVLYSQAGSHGRWLGRVSLVYDTVRRRVTASEAEMLPVNDAVPVCEALRAEVGAELARAQEYLDGAVGEAAVRFEGEGQGASGSPVEDLLCRAIARATGADIVLHGSLGEASLEAGPVRRSDIWRLVPYENRLAVMWLTMQELREVLEENAAHAGGPRFLAAHGLKYRLRAAARQGERVEDLRLADGTRPHPRLRIKVATTNYLLASGGGRFRTLSGIARRPTSRLEMTDIDTRTAVTEYVRKYSPIAPAGQGTDVVRVGARR